MIGGDLSSKQQAVRRRHLEGVGLGRYADCRLVGVTIASELWVHLTFEVPNKEEALTTPGEPRTFYSDDYYDSLVTVYVERAGLDVTALITGEEAAE